MLDFDAMRVLKWDRRGFITDTTLEVVPESKTLWWLLRPNHTPPDAVRLYPETPNLNLRPVS